MKLNEKIMKLRKEKGLSQEEFGNEINVSRQAVSKWENDESKPDIEKIQEIVKKFDVSYEYLLNDELDTQEQIKTQEEEKVSILSENIPGKKKKLLKVILIIIIVYLLFSAYKFIAFYRFYLIANSFSEENYWMNQGVYAHNDSNNIKTDINISTKKVGDKIVETNYSNDEEHYILDEKGEMLPYSITFTDISKKECYTLNYMEDENMYVYNDRTKDCLSQEEIDELFLDKNIIKENTLSQIPSGFKEILLASINPRYYFVSIINREFRVGSIYHDSKVKFTLTNDYLIESMQMKNGEDIAMNITYSYDYVQDHFTELTNPLEEYKDRILFEK